MNKLLLIFIAIFDGFIRCTIAANTCSVNYNPLRKIRQAAFRQSLYKAEDGIVELDVNTFASTVQNAEKAHLVEFYNFWCGHCRKYAPTYVRLAKDVQAWNQVVVISAINCADERNSATCTNNGVRSVPYLKYFGKRSHAAGTQTTAHTSLAKLREDLTKLILREYGAQPHSDWPKFSYLNQGSQLSEIWSQISSDVRYLAVVFDRDGSSTAGAQLLLDLWKESAWIAARRALNTHPIATSLHIVDFPSVAVFRRRNSTPIRISELHRFSTMQFIQQSKTGITHDTRPIPTVETTAQLPTAISNRRRKAKYFASETDILLASWYALYHEVPFYGHQLQGASFTDLANFVHTLKKYFPQTEEVRRALTSLSVPDDVQRLERSRRARLVFRDLDWFLSNHSSVTPQDWKAQIESAERTHGYPFPKNSSWVHCQGSAARFRGYTCGLWTTFHTLTAHAYLQDGLTANFDPLEVPKSIQGWVKRFFGCSHCAQHFMRMTTQQIRMEDWIRYPSDVVIYLWKAHNIVNNRLKGDPTEDPTFPKLQFPADFLCDTCQDFSDRHNATRWNTRQVMKYLLRYYSHILPHGASIASATTNQPVAQFEIPQTRET